MLCAAAQAVLRELLVPRQWKPSEDRSFFLDAEQVNTLCDQAERVFLDEPTVLRLRGERICAPLEEQGCCSHTHDATQGCRIMARHPEQAAHC